MNIFITLNKKILLKIFFCLFFLLFLLFLFKLISNHKSENVFKADTPIELKCDLNGDNINENLIIENIDNYYNFYVNFNNQKLYLVNKSKSKNLIDINPYCDFKIELIDISRDNIPEIILYGTLQNKPISYIFQWENNNFVEKLTFNDNILGILNSKNSKTPILLNKKSSFLFNNNSIKTDSSQDSNIPSLGTILKFIDLVELQFDLLELPNIFAETISSDDINEIWKLNKENFSYKFQNAYFKDVDWNSDGTVSSLLWTLSFQKRKIVDNTISEFIFYIKVDLELNSFKISTIKK